MLQRRSKGRQGSRLTRFETTRENVWFIFGGLKRMAGKWFEI
jgi:hypothetical protein